MDEYTEIKKWGTAKAVPQKLLPKYADAAPICAAAFYAL